MSERESNELTDFALIAPNLHSYWFLTSMDGGESWQLTDGPFTEREANRVKDAMTGHWVIVQMTNVAGRNGDAK